MELVTQKDFEELFEIAEQIKNKVEHFEKFIEEQELYTQREELRLKNYLEIKKAFESVQKECNSLYNNI